MYIWTQGSFLVMFIILLGTIIKHTQKAFANYAQEATGYEDCIIT